MKKYLLILLGGSFLLSCNNSKDKTAAGSGGDTATAKMDAAPADLPYTASYSSHFTQDVPDADLKMVLMTYKNWQDAKLNDLGNSMGDTVVVDMSSGAHITKTRADLMKMWTTYRDSLSKVDIDMQGWQKLYEPAKKESYVVTWYKETDWYKDGRADSAYFHDINEIKNGKITWYSQYKRPAK